MSFGRIRNKTLPLHLTKVDSEKSSESRFSLDVLEKKNLEQFAENTLEIAKKPLQGVGKIVGFTGRQAKGFIDGVARGVDTGWEVGTKFWYQAIQDLNKITPVNENVMSEFHFNMLKRGLTEEEQAYYKFLKANDETLQGSYDEYVEKEVAEAHIRRKEFVDAMDERITSKKEKIAEADDRGLELIDEYGVSAMVGYGLGQMLGNPNEMVSNVIATTLGIKFSTGTKILGMDDLLNITENIMSNAVSESIIAEAKDEEFSYSEVATRTAGTFIFFKGMGELYKKGKANILTKSEAKRLKRAENIMAEDVITARVTEDAIERGLVNEELGIKIEYPSERAMDLSQEIGRDKYKAYIMKKTAEEFAYDEITGEGLTNTNRLILTKSRKKSEAELRDLIKGKYGDDYSFEEYIKDMDYAYKNSKFSETEIESNMKIEKGSEITNKEIDQHVTEAEFLETQDISMINTLDSELADAREVLKGDDASINQWFTNNC